ncbi:transporter, sodium/bile acid symporter family [Xylanimonas cellulosilytica DSM 15894]|uniref:Transporter, sodium/bile acid symporter family n=1 Tax=Xylanimonas cellulosilytica (strain DSM 15894 / JCM 12276 / CECT 5975 / KCTC 9989 / LMG 20990 / NBRC 107835 / XIL07) TaxID=446471 RepID=D1BY98_XYLCX|nr:bile acid:sodium symporter family protein [Xylanimonas cellulosilytica]ACZ29941.1 transporter, sodium/bile acid symporter family [Xylanimonas cellulosilytica DSM 15894]
MRRVLKTWVDPFIVALVGVLVVGLVVPFGPGVLHGLDVAADVAVVLLFLLYGARLPVREVLAGLKHWRLQSSILVTTFVLFPALGLMAREVAGPWLGTGLALGVLYVCLLPSTVQSSVAMVSIARGNVAGAICGATVSNVLGMLVTPLLVLWLMHDVVAGAAGAASVGLGRLGNVLLTLLLPFVVGQVAQHWVGGWVRAHRPLTLAVDRGTILLVVLGAVSSATAAGTWAGLSPWALVALVGVCAVVLAVVLAVTWWGGRAGGLAVEDRIALLHCGSTKSLATGLPMAGVLLPAAVLGSVVVPVVVFHQLELMVCSVLARRQALRD